MVAEVGSAPMRFSTGRKIRARSPTQLPDTQCKANKPTRASTHRCNGVASGRGRPSRDRAVAWTRIRRDYTNLSDADLAMKKRALIKLHLRMAEAFATNRMISFSDF